jgi:hypothetical protein
MRLLYHYALPIKNVRLIFKESKGLLIPRPKYSDPDFLPAYQWIQKEVGFFPIFIAIGDSIESIQMTGFQNSPQHVLFSFEDVKGIFMDYDNWHIVLNASFNNYQLTPRQKSLIFKYSWQRHDWLRKAIETPHSVQLVAKEINLIRAQRAWIQNPKIKPVLEKLGFLRIKVKSIL